MTKVTKQQFMDNLRTEWEAQVTQEGDNPSYEFKGWTGMEYNSWLDHRHGWPMTDKGLCVVSLTSACCEEHDDGLEVPYTECTICSDLVRMYLSN